MSTLGEIGLLLAFIGSGYAAFACAAGTRLEHRGVRRSGMLAAWLTLALVTGLVGIVAAALLRNDFGFQYVVEYSNALMPWYFSLSALWVGQAGSLLLWTWFLAAAAIVFHRLAPAIDPRLRDTAFALLMVYVCFLSAVMLFGADPVQANLTGLKPAGGLSPVLQHPAMLIHPPVVFLGYAAWGIPFALALAALILSPGPGNSAFSTEHSAFQTDWLRAARPWALAAWTIQGIGILLGAFWAYEVLGWGGYWSWDPVENGSLLPWLAGTALIHGLLAWQHCGGLKKSTLLLAVAVFGLCNFATFLTRSGIFSSLHEFSQSPIGWMFLGAMLVLCVGGGGLVIARRARLAPLRPLGGLASRETLVLLSMFVLVLLTTVILVGTLSIPLSGAVLGRSITLGSSYYNHLLIPSAAYLLTAMALAPLLRWSAPPSATQKKALAVAAAAALAITIVAWVAGVRHPVGLLVAAMAGLAVAALAVAVVVDLAPRSSGGWPLLLVRLAAQRRPYAAFVMHLGLISLAVGVAGSSLGTHKLETALRPGETTPWAGRSVRFAELKQFDLPDKFIAEAQLDVTEPNGQTYTLRPAQDFFRAQQTWNSRVAVHSNWAVDFYVILQGHKGDGRVNLTLIENPLVRWMWLSGWVIGLAAIVALWPARQRRSARVGPPRPKTAAWQGRRADAPHRARSR